MPMLLFCLLKDSLKMVSLLNQRPYTTLARFISEARTLPLKPPRYDEFLDMMAAGGYTDLKRLRRWSSPSSKVSRPSSRVLG
jgi:hypothetical protein